MSHRVRRRVRKATGERRGKMLWDRLRVRLLEPCREEDSPQARAEAISGPGPGAPPCRNVHSRGNDPHPPPSKPLERSSLASDPFVKCLEVVLRPLHCMRCAFIEPRLELEVRAHVPFNRLI